MSPIFDVPSTLPYGDTTMALTMGGRAEGLIRKHLLDFGQSLGLVPATAVSGLERVLKTTASLIPDLESRSLPFDEECTRRWVRQLTRRRRDAIHW